MTLRVAVESGSGLRVGPAAGLIGSAGFLVATTVAVLTYAGTPGEAFSPLNYWVSELGELGVSSPAVLFNAGLIVGGLGFGAFMAAFGRARPGRLAAAAGIVGLVSGIFGALVGAFPLGSGGPHRTVAIAFFVLGAVAITLASLDVWRRPSVAFPRWLGAIGAVVALAYLGFIATTLTFDRVDYLVVARPSFLVEPVLEWLAVGGTLVWTLLASLSVAPAGACAPDACMKSKKRVVTSPGVRATGSSSGQKRRTPTRRSIRCAVEPATVRNRAPVRIEPVAPAGEAPPAALFAADLSVDLGRGLVLANPILVASGTFGYGIEYGDVVDVQRIGAICCKGTTLKPRVGNPPPRVTETPGGMLNSIGLQNPGVDAVVEKYAPLWQTWQTKVLVNVSGESIADYVEVTRRLDGVPGVAGIELNISCPNVGKGGIQFAIDASAAGAVTAAVRRATDLPLLVKLSPNVADVRPIAKAIEEGGADAITAVNTLSGIAIDPGRRRPLLGNVFGGLSGPAIKPVALRIVYETAQVVKIPIVAIGGITELADVLDYLAVGAVAAQVGTAIFADPTVPTRLVDELAAECRRRGLESYRDLIGTALPAKPGSSGASAKGVEYRP